MDNTHSVRCPTCRGRGDVTVRCPECDGYDILSRCRTCRGYEIVEEPCLLCSGTGGYSRRARGSGGRGDSPARRSGLFETSFGTPRRREEGDQGREDGWSLREEVRRLLREEINQRYEALSREAEDVNRHFEQWQPRYEEERRIGEEEMRGAREAWQRPRKSGRGDPQTCPGAGRMATRNRREKESRALGMAGQELTLGIVG